MGSKRRWLWVLLASAPVALCVTQCTPVVGCWGDRTYIEGQHFGFTIGMNRQAAADIIAAAYDVADVSVWSGDNDLVSIETLSQLKVLAAPFQQWRFGSRHRPYCAWDRNVVLVFRDKRLLTIKDEHSITLP
jgi:hypothetical protein